MACLFALLLCDEVQKSQLESMARAGTTPQKTARKCEVILLASQGVSNYSIAQRTGLSRPTILAARVAFTDRGIEGIRKSKKRKRSRRALTPEVEQKILDTTLKTRPANATHWSVRVLAAKLGVSRMMVQRVWQHYDIQPHRVEKFKISQDPNFENKVRDVVGLYLDPPDRALVLCVDEKSQIQALDRTAPLLPLRPGLSGGHTLVVSGDQEERAAPPDNPAPNLPRGGSEGSPRKGGRGATGQRASHEGKRTAWDVLARCTLRVWRGIGSVSPFQPTLGPTNSLFQKLMTTQHRIEVSKRFDSSSNFHEKQEGLCNSVVRSTPGSAPATGSKILKCSCGSCASTSSVAAGNLRRVHRSHDRQQGSQAGA